MEANQALRLDGVVVANARREDGLAVADRLGVSLLDTSPADGLIVLIDSAGLALQLLGRGAPGPVRVSFADPALRHRRRGGQNEMLGRAIGIRSGRTPAVLDATGGFGRDAFVLADLGCSVTLCERSPVMALLLEAALAEARADDDWLREVTSLMQLFPGDARDLGPEHLAGIEVIYLDPMFPFERRALPTKEMQVLHALLDAAEADSGRVDDEEALLAWALTSPVARVVAKRPLRAPKLPGPAPSHVLRGRSVRFDVYTLRGFTDK